MTKTTNRLFFGCLLIALCWYGRDGVRRKEATVEKSRFERVPAQSEAKTK